MLPLPLRPVAMPVLPTPVTELLHARPLTKASSQLADLTMDALDEAVCRAAGKALGAVRVHVGSNVLPRYSVLNAENVCHPQLAKRFATAFVRQKDRVEAASLGSLLSDDRDAFRLREEAMRTLSKSYKKQTYVAPTLRDLGPRLLFHGVRSESALVGITRQGLLAANDRRDDGGLLAMASGYGTADGSVSDAVILLFPALTPAITFQGPLRPGNLPLAERGQGRHVLWEGQSRKPSGCRLASSVCRW